MTLDHGEWRKIHYNFLEARGRWSGKEGWGESRKRKRARGRKRERQREREDKGREPEVSMFQEDNDVKATQFKALAFVVFISI
jgi:hypothetical protein